MAQVEMLREWLQVERSLPDAGQFPTASLSGREALGELPGREPGTAAFVWQTPVRWSETTVREVDPSGSSPTSSPLGDRETYRLPGASRGGARRGVPY